MVKLFVGPDKTLFVVHKLRLCRRIPYFEKMFNGHFKETVEQEASFPEDKAATFDILLEWVYNFNHRKVRELVAVKNAAGAVSASWYVSLAITCSTHQFQSPDLDVQFFGDQLLICLS